MEVNGFAQNKIDDYISIVNKHKADTAEVNALNNLFSAKRKNNLEQAKKFLDKAIVLAKKLGYIKGEAMSYRHYGTYYGIIGEFDLAIENLEKGKKIFENVGDKLGQVSCINGLANIYSKKGDYQRSLKYYLQTEEINSALEHKSGIAKAKYNIGTVHYFMGQYDKALEYFESSLKIKESISDSAGMVVTWNAIGSIYSNLEQFKKALAVYHKIRPICMRQNNQSELALVYNNIGANHYFLNELDSAKYYYTKSIEVNRLLNDQFALTSTYSNLGGLMLLQKNGSLAKVYYDSSLVISKRINSPHEQAKGYEGLAQANELLGNYKDAYNYFVKFHLLNDSVVGENVQQNISDLQLKYESGKKDLQIAQLEKSEINALAIAEKRKFFVILIGSFALVIVLILTLYIGRRKSREKLRNSELKQNALRAQMNPHFIFNSLNSIQRLYIEGKEDVANDYMADFSHLLRGILENSGKNTVSIEEEIRITKLYLDLEVMRTDNQFDYDITVSPDLDIQKLVPPLILQPYVENAIWHGILPNPDVKGRICIQLNSLDDTHLSCTITDNGVGYYSSLKKKTEAYNQTAKGMSITAERIGGERSVSIEELVEGGTKVSLTIKYAR